MIINPTSQFQETNVLQNVKKDTLIKILISARITVVRSSLIIRQLVQETRLARVRALAIMNSFKCYQMFAR